MTGCANGFRQEECKSPRYRPEQWNRDNVAREVNAAKQREAGEITVLG